MVEMAATTDHPNSRTIVSIGNALRPNNLQVVWFLWHGHTCEPFRDVCTMSGETVAERYERTISRLEQITQVGCQVKIKWECEFDDAGLVNQKP